MKGIKLYIICCLIGIIIGLPLGAYIYAKFLDKPEVVNNNKIKLKRNKNVVFNEKE